MAELILLNMIGDRFRAAIEKSLKHNYFDSHGFLDYDYHATFGKNVFLKGSPYFFNKPLEFVHWTSLTNLVSILNSKEFRLYDLHNSSDPKEFIHAASILGYDPKEAEFRKGYFFSLSFCERQNLNNEFLWGTYGKDYSGAAIEFEIVGSPENWDRHLLSSVYYKLPQEFEDLRAETKSVCDDYKDYPISFSIDLGKLIGFHKEEGFADEKEVRLATYFPFQYDQDYLKNTRTEFRIEDNRNRVTRYLPLPLWIDSTSAYVKSLNPELERTSSIDDTYFESHPKIILKKIHVGKNCGISIQEWGNFRSKLLEMARYNLGYEIEIDINFYPYPVW